MEQALIAASLAVVTILLIGMVVNIIFDEWW